MIGIKVCKTNEFAYITLNYRHIIENSWLDDFQYLCSPTEFHDKRYIMRFTCSRAIAQELTRHRVFSFLMESQRYINYSKERHGGEITYIIPSWSISIQPNVLKYSPFEITSKEAEFMQVCFDSEKRYFSMLESNATPQQARDVLPNATKTELIITGFSSDWRHLLDLRCFGKTGAPHPDMLYLMQKAQKAMQEAGIWEDIMSKPSKFN